MSAEELIKKLLEETGANNVKGIDYDDELKEWVLTFKNNLEDERFATFIDLYEFLDNG